MLEMIEELEIQARANEMIIKEFRAEL